mmetsp:Transcript_74370/g.187361  ORF Transcript_74370/g.187361 Transcript_74370/m.187361 type:complete len:186 (-) Transcript_74370:94-651(-)
MVVVRSLLRHLPTVASGRGVASVSRPAVAIVAQAQKAGCASTRLSCFSLAHCAFSSGPGEVRYTDTHEWIKVGSDGIGTVGISDFAQEKLGEVQVVELPQIGQKFEAKEEMASIESVKTISAANAVCDCEIVAVNQAVEDDPTLLNSSPEDEGWIVKVKFSADLAEHTMDKAAYDQGTEDGSIPP